MIILHGFGGPLRGASELKDIRVNENGSLIDFCLVVNMPLRCLIVEFMLLANAWSVADKMLPPCVSWETLQVKGHRGCPEGKVTCCGLGATSPTAPLGALMVHR